MWSSFSILERIVVVETRRPVLVLVECMSSFSILERIVVVETAMSNPMPQAMSIFQYPRTDRGG